MTDRLIERLTDPMDFIPQRVVSLQPSVTAILDQLGVLDRVVACTKYCADVCPEIRQSNRAIVEDSWTAQAAEILATRPDLVIAAVPYQEKAIAEIMKSGVRFLGLGPRTLADIYGDIAAIAGLMHVPERGDAVIAEMLRELETVRQTASGSSSRPRIYCEAWGKPLIASSPWVAELVAIVGGEFLGDPGAQTTADAVRAAAPEVLIFAWCGAGDRVPLEKIVAERGWQDLPAVRAGRVFCLRDELLNTPAPTLLLGLRALAHALHPELFSAAPGMRAMSAAPVL